MSVGALPPISPKPEHALELETIIPLFNSCAIDHPIAVKLAKKIQAAHSHIPDNKFFSYLQKAIYLTRRQIPHHAERASKCTEYASKHPHCTIPYLLADFRTPKLDVAKFRELLPLLNAVILHSYRSYEKDKRLAQEAAESLARHLTKGHQNDPCEACQNLASISAKTQKKQYNYELMQKYVEYMLNWAECKLILSREKEYDTRVIVTGMIAGAVIGGYLGQILLMTASVESLIGTLGGAFLGGITLKKIKKLTQPNLLDRPRNEEPAWISLSDRVRYRFETISSGYFGRMLDTQSFTLGEVEITFGRLDVVTCLFNFAEDWRIHGKSLFELRRHFIDRLDKQMLHPEDCLQILTTLKTTFIGRGLLHFKTKSFFGLSYSCFFDDINERCEKGRKTAPAVVSFEEAQEKKSPINSGFVVTPSPPWSHRLEEDLNKLYQRGRGSLQSLAEIKEGKYGFDPHTNTFYPAAELLKRKFNKQSIDTVVAGIKEVCQDFVSTLRVASSQIEKNASQFAVWKVRFPYLQEDVKAALEGLQRLRKVYENHPEKVIKLDAAKEEFEKTINSALKVMEDKLKLLTASPPPPEIPVKRPLQVLVPFDNSNSLEQMEFISSFFINLMQAEEYLKTKRAAFKEGEYQVVKSSKEMPWSYAVTPQNNTMLHYHVSPYTAGRARGSAFKTIKLGFFLEKHEHVVKLSTGFEFSKLTGSDRNVFEMAKDEQSFLRRMQEFPHPNVVRTYEICWRYKNGKVWQIIYQSYAQQGDLFFAWKNIIHDNAKVEKILKGLISGLCHLHSLGIVVNDIKLTNIVLDKESNPQYIDFNCSHNTGSQWAWGGTLPMTDIIVVMTQCVHKHGLPAHPSRDIWSLGLIFYMLLFKTATIPWWPDKENFASQADFEKIIEDKDRLFPEPPPSDIWKHACWEMLRVDPRLRPTAKTLEQRLLSHPLIR